MECNVKLGCTTLDFTMNLPAFQSGRYDIIAEEFKLFKEVAGNIETKVIIEVCKLNDEQIRTACKMVVDAGIDWVKSSTGQYQGPTMQQVAIILDSLKGTNTHCKVSGVKFPRPQNAYAFLSAGVEIIGSQGVVEIIESFDLLKELGVLPS
jgi:deoxyribose-phosphate aldolase